MDADVLPRTKTFRNSEAGRRLACCGIFTAQFGNASVRYRHVLCTGRRGWLWVLRTSVVVWSARARPKESRNGRAVQRRDRRPAAAAASTRRASDGAASCGSAADRKATERGQPMPRGQTRTRRNAGGTCGWCRHVKRGQRICNRIGARVSRFSARVHASRGALQASVNRTARRIDRRTSLIRVRGGGGRPLRIYKYLDGRPLAWSGIKRHSLFTCTLQSPQHARPGTGYLVAGHGLHVVVICGVRGR
ncbi:uncharacterized protein V1510DRAFT_289108 [Dipodascopsis tothii]|uniref:uncharacterized protein n=1 Tax=Dipodascopsis tothii TaxID=44089 RepID=UPI0034CD3008